MSHEGSHFRPYMSLSGWSALGPVIPYAKGLKAKKLQGKKRKGMHNYKIFSDHIEQTDVLALVGFLLVFLWR